MDNFINVEILRNPINWLTVFFMVFLPLAVAGLIVEHYAPNSQS